MEPIRAWRTEFVGIDQVSSKGLPAYPKNADKLSGGALWVAVVDTPPDDPKGVKERVQTRVRRLMRSGMAVGCVLVPCDGVTVIVSTSDLAEAKARGRRQLAPTSGRWCPTGLVLQFLERTLASTAVNGRVWWTDGWKPDERPKKAYGISGDARVAFTAYRILESEDYEFTGSRWDADPISVLLDAQKRAERFWADPRCAICDAEIAPKDKYRWRDGTPLCGVCDLALDLDAILTKGVTEREIEAHLRRRKLTFKRRRDLIEEALSLAGADKLPSGIWMRKAAGKEVG